MSKAPATAQSFGRAMGIAGGSPVNSHISDVIEFTRILDFALESKIQAKSGGTMQLIAPVAQAAEKYGGIERRTS